MNHLAILKQAWKIVWRFRTLWVFGVLLALTTPGSQTFQYSFNQRDVERMEIPLPAEVQQFFSQLNQQLNFPFTAGNGQLLVGVAIALGCLLLLFIVVSFILRFTSEGALIGMVDHFEASGEQLRAGQGWKLGWAKAGRLFLTELAVKLPMLVAFLVLFGCAALPILPALVQNNHASPMAIATSIGLVFIVGMFALAVGVVVSVWLRLAFRAIVLEGAGVGEGLRRGWKLLRAEWKNTGLMWLLLVGARLVFGLGTLLFGLFLAAGALVIGGGFGLLTNVIAGGSILAAAIVGVVIFLVLLILPLIFVNGLLETYISSAWTLAYRSMTLTVIPESVEKTEG